MPEPVPSPILEGTVANNTPYLITVSTMFAIGVAGVIGVALARPEVDILLVFSAVFGFLTPTTAAILAFQKAQETHLSVNSRLDGFIKNATIASRAQGVVEGAKKANERTDELNK